MIMAPSSNARDSLRLDQKSSNANGSRPRVPSSRAAEFEKPFREDSSPAPFESIGSQRRNETGSKRLSKEYRTADERRTEKTQTTMRERIHVITRSPVKESATAGNRGEPGRDRVKSKSRLESGSSAAQRLGQEPVEG